MSNRAGTAPDPRQMGAGRDMDKAVALLMGCRVVKTRPKGLYDLIVPGGVNQIDFVERDGPWCAVPHYSTDMNETRMVEEQIAHLGLQQQYALALAEMLAPRATSLAMGTFALITASAEDRCRAALWVVGERA